MCECVCGGRGECVCVSVWVCRHEGDDCTYLCVCVWVGGWVGGCSESIEK